MRSVAFVILGLISLCLPAAGGCAAPSRPVGIDWPNVEQAARRQLERGLRYPDNTVVRVEAVEALQLDTDKRVLPWIRTALLDQEPAVRFSAAVACGMLKDELADGSLRNLLHDEDASVRVAALFARHRLGFTQDSGKLTYYLLDDKDAAVRRNAALVLGLLGEPGAMKVLAKAMRDPDEGVRQHALEAMARLGNTEAGQELAFMANSGVGSEEVFAVLALAETGDSRYVATFRYKLSTAVHLETKLAAARALGAFGYDDGLVLALHALASPPVRDNDPEDTPQRQSLRIEQMACAALGAIGSEDAVPELSRVMNEAKDPRVRVSAARAILRILAKRDAQPLPWGSGGEPE